MASADDSANGRPKIPDGSDLADGARRAAGAAGDKLGGAADAAKTGLTGAAGAASGAVSGAGDAAKAGLSGAAGVAGKATSGVSGAAKAGLSGATGMAGKAASGVSDTLSGATGVAGKAASGVTGAASLAGSGRGGGWRSYVPPNTRGKFPWKWRWLGLPLLLAACTLGGCMGWRGAEDHFGAVAAKHLACEFPGDTDGMDLDFSYRDVTVEGTLPAGASDADVRRVLEDGSTDSACLEQNGIDPDDDPGIRGIAVPAALAAVIAAPSEPDPTAVPEPEPTDVPAPTATAVPEPTATAEPEPEPTEVPAPVIAAIAATAAFDGQSITLTGEVASEEQRAELVAAAIAQVGEDNVIDELTIADGDPSDTSGARVGELATLIASFGGNVTDGFATIDDAALTYELNSPSDEARDALDLPGSGTVTVPETAEPAFTG